MSSTALLLLADSRLPAGGHAHSGGLEAAVTAGRVSDVEDLDGFLRGRLATAGLVASSFAAAACVAAATPAPGRHDVSVILELDTEYAARTPSPVLRRVSRQQGRALLRAARAMWTVPDEPAAPHHPVSLGIVAAAAGLSTHDAALAAAYTSVTGPASAAVRLLGLDPYAVQRLLADLAPAVDETAARGAAHADADPADLPAAGAPLLDIGAEYHATWEVRLFAS